MATYMGHIFDDIPLSPRAARKLAAYNAAWQKVGQDQIDSTCAYHHDQSARALAELADVEATSRALVAKPGEIPPHELMEHRDRLTAIAASARDQLARSAAHVERIKAQDPLQVAIDYYNRMPAMRFTEPKLPEELIAAAAEQQRTANLERMFNDRAAGRI